MKMKLESLGKSTEKELFVVQPVHQLKFFSDVSQVIGRLFISSLPYADGRYSRWNVEASLETIVIKNSLVHCYVPLILTLPYKYFV